MKTSLLKSSSSVLILAFSLSVAAGPVAQVADVTGPVFVMTDDGQTNVLKLSQHIDEKSEILVEEGASVTLTDYYDSTYHLVGGTHLKFFDGSVQLKKGKTWIQSLRAKHPLALTTANGFVNFFKTEFIATFDPGSNKTQILVVSGEAEVSNVLSRDLKYNVGGGAFTLIDPEVENGIPRAPTKVGLQSLTTALAEFKKLPSKMTSTFTRSVASVEENKSVKKGEIIFITTHRREPASVKDKSKPKQINKSLTKKSEFTAIDINIYGSSWRQLEENVSPRMPASIDVKVPEMPKNRYPILQKDTAFSESLKRHQANQPKYSKELNNLIRDLNSY